jgi:hypothetical protein
MAYAKHLRIPENWLQCKIAEHFHRSKDFTVVLEGSMFEGKWDCRADSPFIDDAISRKGRVDLLLLTPDKREWIAVEVKGALSNWPSFAADAERIREFVESRFVRSGSVVYASCLLTDSEMQRERELFAHKVDAGQHGGVVKFSDRLDDPTGIWPDHGWQVSTYTYPAD